MTRPDTAIRHQIGAQHGHSTYAGLIRAGSIGWLGAGILRIAAAIIPYEPQNAALEGLYAAIDIGIVFGMVAFAIRYWSGLGHLGALLWAVALVGIASIVGPDAQMFGIPFYEVGAATFLIALAGTGLCLWPQTALRGPILCWVASAASLLLVASPLGNVALLPSGILLGIGLGWAGWQLGR